MFLCVRLSKVCFSFIYFPIILLLYKKTTNDNNIFLKINS